MAVADESDLEQLQDSENAAGAGDTDAARFIGCSRLAERKETGLKMALIQIKMKWPSIFMSMAMLPSNLTAADYDNADDTLPGRGWRNLSAVQP